jgi:serine/threonine-protein kinase
MSDKIPLLADEENVMSRNELTDRDIDEIDRLLMRAMSRAALRLASGEAASAPGLTKEEHDALASLGTPMEFAQRVAARARGESPAVTTPGSTFVAANALASTVPARDNDVPEDAAEREALLIRHRACRRKRRFTWKYQYLKDKRPIGFGGQGTVYLAKCRDPFVGRRAIKVHSPEPYPNRQAYVEDMERLRLVAAAVHEANHDNLIYVDNLDAHGGIYVMIMRLVDGFDLRRLKQPEVVERLKEKVSEKRWKELKDVVYAQSGAGSWGLAPGIAVNIIEKLLRALRALHRKKIVHCDVKPSNVMLDCYGSIRLIDLGSAFQLDAPPRQHAWTPWYAPPEVLEGGKWTPQGDQASLGYMLIELLSGRPDLMWSIPNADSAHTLDDHTRDDLVKAKRLLPSRLKELLPVKAQDSELLMKLCRRLIDPDPAARFENAGEAINHTAVFKDQLVRANLAVPWVWEIERWIMDVKNSMIPDPTSVGS